MPRKKAAEMQLTRYQDEQGRNRYMWCLCAKPADWKGIWGTAGL